MCTQECNCTCNRNKQVHKELLDVHSSQFVSCKIRFQQRPSILSFLPMKKTTQVIKNICIIFVQRASRQILKRIHSSPPSHISLQININFPSQYLQIISNTFQEDNPIPAYVMPLRGDENSFQYKSDTCEYIIEAAVGREKKKAARYVIK